MKSIRSARRKRHASTEVRFDAKTLVAAAEHGVRAALARHKARGNKVVVWRDGRVVMLKPEEIEL